MRSNVSKVIGSKKQISRVMNSKKYNTYFAFRYIKLSIILYIVYFRGYVLILLKAWLITSKYCKVNIGLQLAGCEKIYAITNILINI
jgi:hypothetical protein